MSPRDAVFYRDNVSSLIDNASAGIDILFTERSIMRYYFFSLKIAVEFPSIDISTGENIPRFEIYMGSEFDGSDWIARFIPVYHESTVDFMTSSITQEVIDASGYASFIVKPADSSGYITFEYTYENIQPWLDAYEYRLNDLNTFGVRFYIENPTLTGPNVDTSYTVKIKDVSIGTPCMNLPEEGEGGKIIINATGPGKVYVNGHKLS